MLLFNTIILLRSTPLLNRAHCHSAGEHFRRRQEQEAKQPQATASGGRRAKRHQAAASVGDSCGREHQMDEHGARPFPDGDEPAEPENTRRASRRRRPHLASPVEAALVPSSVRQHRAPGRAVDGGDDAGRDRALRPRHRGGLPVLLPVRRALRPGEGRRRRHGQGQEQWFGDPVGVATEKAVAVEPRAAEECKKKVVVAGLLDRASKTPSSRFGR